MTPPLDDERLQALRRRLLEEKADLENREHQNDHFGFGASQLEYMNELSMYDNHPADLGTETYERGKDLALLRAEVLRMERVQDALERMDTGEYGRCAECGRFIPIERLEALPTAIYCIEHEPRQGISNERPAEESVRNPPWGRTSRDESPDEWTGFDGEDTWQIVASWGNSNSPAMVEDRHVEDYDSVHAENDENEGFVQPIESFLATDITGRNTVVVRNGAYRHYLDSGEGDHFLEASEELADFDPDNPGDWADTSR